MSRGDEELALLDVDRLALRRDAARMKSVWRHRKAGVCSTSTTCGDSSSGVVLVHVGEHRHAELAFHLGQDLEALVHARARGRSCPSSGWPCRSEDLKMNGMPSLRGDLLQLAGDVDAQLLATRRRRGRR